MCDSHLMFSRHVPRQFLVYQFRRISDSYNSSAIHQHRLFQESIIVSGSPPGIIPLPSANHAMRSKSSKCSEKCHRARLQPRAMELLRAFGRLLCNKWSSIQCLDQSARRKSRSAKRGTQESETDTASPTMMKEMRR